MKTLKDFITEEKGKPRNRGGRIRYLVNYHNFGKNTPNNYVIDSIPTTDWKSVVKEEPFVSADYWDVVDARYDNFCNTDC